MMNEFERVMKFRRHQWIGSLVDHQKAKITYSTLFQLESQEIQEQYIALPPSL